jgi:hypothetical protein
MMKKKKLRKFKLIKNYPSSDARKGEVIYETKFGEFCPKNSLRGYSEKEILAKPYNWVELD